MLARYLPFSLFALAGVATSAQEPEAGVALHYGDSCDARNRRLYVENRHTFRSYVVTVSWTAVGGKTVTMDLTVEPKVTREVGCATDGAQIVKAVLMEF